MSIQRRLPNSDQTRDRALTTAKERMDAVAPADMAITPITQERLTNIQDLFKKAMQERANALVAQADGTAAMDPSKNAARMYISHFIQVFNLGVTRAVYTASARAFYQLDVSSDALPSLSTEAEILQWGQRLKDGDTARTTAGGAAMSNPTIAEVNTKTADFKTKNDTQGLKKTDYDNAQQAVVALHDEADKTIKKVWDEVETFYNEEEPASMRRKAREWGEIFVSTIPNIIHISSSKASDGNPLAITITIVETDDIFNIPVTGTGDVKTNLVEGVTLRCQATGFVTQDIAIEFTSGVHEYNQGVEMVGV